MVRERIDLQGEREVTIEPRGDGRIEISIPSERIAELRKDAQQREALRALGYVAQGTDESELERVLARLGECPEAGIAFHVP